MTQTLTANPKDDEKDQKPVLLIQKPTTWAHTSNQPQCKVQKKNHTKIHIKSKPNYTIDTKKSRCNFKKKKIDNLHASSGGGVEGGDERGVHSLGGLPCSGEDAIDQLGQPKVEGKGDRISGVAAMRDKERDAGEGRDRTKGCRFPARLRKINAGTGQA